MRIKVSPLEALVAMGFLNYTVLEVEDHDVTEELDHLLDCNATDDDSLDVRSNETRSA